MRTKPKFTEEELKKRLEKSRPVQREKFFKDLKNAFDQASKDLSSDKNKS